MRGGWDWLGEARAALGRLVAESVSGPRGLIIECSSATRRGPWLLCRPSGSLPSALHGGVVASVTVLEEPGVPMHRGMVWLEATPRGLLVGDMDLAAAEPRAPLRLLVHGYASPVELSQGVSLELLGLHVELERLCRGDHEAAAEAIAAILGALLLRRQALPAPPSWLPEPRPWLEPGPGGYVARRAWLYVTPAWQPNTGFQPGMGAPPSGVFMVEPGAVVVEEPQGSCRWRLKLL